MRYNLRAKEKSFEIGQKVLVLTPDSTSSKTFSRWVGPAVIKDKLSKHSYLVDINGAVKHIHADKLKKYHMQVTEVICDTVTTGHELTRVNHCAVIYDGDSDSGSVDVIDTDQYQQQESWSSQRIDLNTFSDLSAEQRTKRLALLDKHSDKYVVNDGDRPRPMRSQETRSRDRRPHPLRTKRSPCPPSSSSSSFYFFCTNSELHDSNTLRI